MGRRPATPLVLRRSTNDEFDEIVTVCARALQWDPDRPNDEFFRWKHYDNAFGASPIWVAVNPDDDRIVGVRTMMRWRLANGTRTLDMVRAVDTATLPEFQGMGIFSKLTMLAVDELTGDGIDAVFNTPNAKSRPGYLKMGWQEVGKLTASMRPGSLRGVTELRRANAAADKWGESCPTGVNPSEAFADDDVVERVLEPRRTGDRLATAFTAASLRWRFGLSTLNYRVFPLTDGRHGGFIVFRVRQRGPLRELDINEVVGAPNPLRVARAIAKIAGDTDTDLVLSTPSVAGTARGLIPIRTLGPLLTWRTLANPAVPTIKDLALSMSTVELF